MTNQNQQADDSTSSSATSGERPILEVNDLRTYFFTDDGVLPSVDGVTFKIEKGKTLGLVGESGSGKSVTSLSILGLIPQPPGKIVGGEVLFEGRDLTKFSEDELRGIRGNDISMIFQEPMTSLNPVYTIGNQIIEAIQLHQPLNFKEARELAIYMLDRVGIPAPSQRIDEFPHQMSGGMKQRAMIAMSLVCKPKLLIADEPTTALDVTIQAQILDLLTELQEEMGMSILFITHDLGVVAEICDDVAVMYAGRIAEYGNAEEIYNNPSHPYTIGLFSSLPQVETTRLGQREDRLYVIPGMVPRPQDFPAGCRFRSRCEFATDECMKLPPLRLHDDGHMSACWYADEVRDGTKEKTGPRPGGAKADPNDFLKSGDANI
ncbi:ABC transporter ATP-binding protein [Bradymonas sediminis]|uniref:Dipeptide ABC transporter ATP-binding protein DppD n=1 Tax=Bradymonas sediminis TaxID=1548548 RepID=A0A2Z4FI51_9DELT|nr:ABC transporter ATP-binding protein [Bradymonas sediminis]AWV88434.1 dipeptide ABC transporter ATP-binding protein DppD [Bradymonas sediminis]TDP77564.1 peptide/nickel transport system ATP-binding protein/oligopeptide transport system ATP-binding protein [Bradymonas sediminis]